MLAGKDSEDKNQTSKCLPPPHPTPPPNTHFFEEKYLLVTSHLFVKHKLFRLWFSMPTIEIYTAHLTCWFGLRGTRQKAISLNLLEDGPTLNWCIFIIGKFIIVSEMFSLSGTTSNRQSKVEFISWDLLNIQPKVKLAAKNPGFVFYQR